MICIMCCSLDQASSVEGCDSAVGIEESVGWLALIARSWDHIGCRDLLVVGVHVMLADNVLHLRNSLSSPIVLSLLVLKA